MNLNPKNKKKQTRKNCNLYRKYYILLTIITILLGTGSH